MFPKVFLELILHAPRFSFASLTNAPRNRLCLSKSLVLPVTSSGFNDPKHFFIYLVEGEENF